jgi:hypothetical protein
MSRGRLLLAIVSVIAFVIILLYDFFGSGVEPNRDGIFPKNEIRLVYAQNLKPDIDFYINIVPQQHQVIFQFYPHFTNFTISSYLAVILPYKGKLIESVGWQANEFSENTVVIKKYSCAKENPCHNPSVPETFTFQLNEKIDQKQSFHHSVRFRFENSAPSTEEYSYILQFVSKNEQPQLGFKNLNREPRVILLLDKTADNIVTTPDAISSSFMDKNLQRIWTIVGGITYQVDFEIPMERNVVDVFSRISVYVGIGLAVINLIPFLIAKDRQGKMPKFNSWPSKEN